MIIIDPQALGPCWTYRLAMIAALRLRDLGYAAYVGQPGEKSSTHADVEPDDWNDAVAHVQIEIGKAMRK
jgi:hypothetical protein